MRRRVALLSVPAALGIAFVLGLPAYKHGRIDLPGVCDPADTITRINAQWGAELLGKDCFEEGIAQGVVVKDYDYVSFFPDDCVVFKARNPGSVRLRLEDNVLDIGFDFPRRDVEIASRRCGPVKVRLQPIAALSAKGSAGKPREVLPSKFQVSAWVTTCFASQQFAAECAASKEIGEYTLRMETSYIQFGLNIEHPSCPNDAHYTTWRDELFALSQSARQGLVVSNFERMAREIAKVCPNLRLLRQSDFANPPDIALADKRDLY